MRSKFFVETHLRKLCVILRSRVLLGCVLIEDMGRRLPLELQQRSLYQGQQGDVSLCAETIKSVFEGDKTNICGRKCISLSSVSCKLYIYHGCRVCFAPVFWIFCLLGRKDLRTVIIAGESSIFIRLPSHCQRLSQLTHPHDIWLFYVRYQGVLYVCRISTHLSATSHPSTKFFIYQHPIPASTNTTFPMAASRVVWPLMPVFLGKAI